MNYKINQELELIAHILHKIFQHNKKLERFEHIINIDNFELDITSIIDNTFDCIGIPKETFNRETMEGFSRDPYWDALLNDCNNEEDVFEFLRQIKAYLPKTGDSK